MDNLKKVIRELKAARLFFEMGSSRADGVVGNLGCRSGVKYIDDALELLEEQKAVEPKLDVDALVCGNCGHGLIHQERLGDNVLFEERHNYCPNCGRKVKWE